MTYNEQNEDESTKDRKHTVFNYFLDRTRRVYLHRIQVLKTIDFRRILGELLPESV